MVSILVSNPAGGLAGTAPNLEGAAGNYWAPPGIRTAAAATAGTLYMAAFYVVRDQAIDRIGGHVTVGAVGSTVTLGVYEDTGLGVPGALLFDAGTIDGNSATAQEITIAQTLRGGRRYWTAALVAGGTPTVRMDSATGGTGWSGRQATLAIAVGTTVAAVGRTQAGISGTALPNPAVPGATLNSAIVTVAFRLA